jgi:hypothetical protein
MRNVFIPFFYTDSTTSKKLSNLTTQLNKINDTGINPTTIS